MEQYKTTPEYIIGESKRKADQEAITNYVIENGGTINAELPLLFLINFEKKDNKPENRYGIYYEGGLLRINNGPNYHQPEHRIELSIHEEYDIVKVFHNFLQKFDEPY